MKIIQPHRIISVPVTDPKQIGAESDKMRELVEHKDFPGRFNEALAIHHSQVSVAPYDFFVVHTNMVKEFGGWSVIANARILEASNSMRFKEACLSYPFRGVRALNRYAKVKVECDVLDAGMFSWKLKHVILDVENIAAFIVQHECGHAQGRFIY